METHKSGCLICGKPLRYFDPAAKLKCGICGREFESDVFCEEEHFVCDGCHSQAGYESISRLALSTGSRNPLLIAREMMENNFINMHGPEHHYLVIAALLAAYKNSGGLIDLAKLLSTARKRAEKVPGGICGFWGACGAAIGSGIFISLVTGATPLSVDEWRLANLMTSRSLDSIARNGGPRCCKRNTYLAILSAVDFVRENMGLSLERPEAPVCSFFGGNPNCRKRACVFFPPGKSTAAPET